MLSSFSFALVSLKCFSAVLCRVADDFVKSQADRRISSKLSRQILHYGAEGQEKISNSTVAVVLLSSSRCVSM